MVPIPAEYLPDFWNQVSSECPTVELTCLLPNGIIVLLKVNYNATLADIKQDLWEKAWRFPLYGKLQADMSQYIFKIVNSMAEVEELIDESRRLCDIRPTGGVLIISECRLNSVDHSINVTIGHLIGKGLQDFDALNSSEINDFRFNMRKMGERIAKKRNRGSWQEKLLYQFPPRMTTSTLPNMENITDIRVETKCDNDYDILKPQNQDTLQCSSFSFNVQPTIKPTKLLERILAKKAQNLRINNAEVPEYVLKVCGRDEYLLGDYSLNQFQYIQDCISEGVIPSLLTVHIDRIPVVHNDYDYLDSFDVRKPANLGNTLRKKKNTVSSWSILDNYVITLSTARKLNCDIRKASEVGIQVGLFHGGKPLCQPLKTEEKLVSEKCEVNFDVSIEFDIQVCNIPRNAKLCFVVYELSKYSKGTKSRRLKEPKDSQTNPIAWANTSVYDYKGQLRTGAMTLYMWTYAEDMMSDEVLHPLGTVASNPNIDYSTTLTLIFKSSDNDETVVYPSLKTVLEYASSIETEQVPETLNQEVAENCERLINDMENFYDLHDQDRKKLWSHRRIWMLNKPEIFPKLLSCVDWDKREEISQVMALLNEWPELPLEKSLELLDYAYADQEVRHFAVKCLKSMSDEDLLLYLLQLVQAIKHEIYLECDLVNFLIERALTNQKIGHYLFWHLRSEMQVAAVSVRFGLILEAYCRGSQEHMPMLQRQLKSIEKLKKCCEVVRHCKDKEKGKAALRECLNNNDDEDTVRSPLDPSYRCSIIRVDKCKVMDSKMRPLWIVYGNSDRYGKDIYVIFKNGDDLRQDMLTLQMLKIMDRLWKREGLDLRMNPYNCISLEYRVGLIQVVLNAETIANIQKEKSSAVVASFKRGSILAWLKDHNTTEKALSKAIDEFTLSCAGYCVATYVLGIADRHSDNIMIKKTGQAFMILRKHGNLILSLFAMMISTGLPELSSEKDLQYLRETLVLSKTDEEALEHFKAKFNEALSNSWKTSLNWASHNISKNNKA